MIFQHTWEKVLNGEKTQTRRIVKPGDEFFPEELGDVASVMHRDYSAYRLVYEVGKIYAVQPGRGKPAVARIQITDIRREDVRNISNDDVRAEGYRHVRDFLHVWASMHDSTLERGTWGEHKLMERPAKRYQAWVLTFETVR